MDAGDCPTLNMNGMENYLLSHTLNLKAKSKSCKIMYPVKIILGIFTEEHIEFDI